MQNLLFWNFLVLLFLHWVCDFVAQTHWQASNKSKSNLALGAHVGTYTLILAVYSALVFGAVAGLPAAAIIMFVLINAVLHFATDWVTSRGTSRLFGLALWCAHKCMSYRDTYGHAPDDEQKRLMDAADGDQQWHNFFVLIGFDQLIHHLTLGVTLWWLFA